MYFESSLYSNLYIPDERIGYLIYVRTYNPFNDQRFLMVEPVDTRMPSNTFRHAWIKTELPPSECLDDMSCLEMAERLIFEKIGHTIERPIVVVPSKKMSFKSWEMLFKTSRRRA